MSAKTQLNIRNNLDLVGEYVAHIHTHTDTPIYLTRLYRNSHVCEHVCVTNGGKELTNICVFLAHGCFCKSDGFQTTDAKNVISSFCGVTSRNVLRGEKNTQIKKYDKIQTFKTQLVI